ncbi:MAG TPA: periplasmic heavy metal sensor [Paraburkholderia sp.]|jgi:uncharacterized membrane protein
MNTRSWKVLMAGSVLLNVFLLGAIAGGAWRWFAAQGEHASLHAQAEPPQRTALRFATDELSPERRRQFLDTLKAARRDAREPAREGREDRREVLALLAAPQLDRQALDAALARTREADSTLRAQVESRIADYAATLTPEERAKFADGLARSGQWRLPPQQRAATTGAASEPD